ncbi:MAG: enoyl-CoA hydratase [Gammaproteobacteria bacterium]|nr:enoyl-CoA hydratase [Gammaproteobacteria bacterium]
MSFSTLEFSVDNCIALITLNRPESANTIGVELAAELLQAAIRCESNADIRAVILTGKGRFFSGGGDVQSFATAGHGAGELLRRITTPLHAAVSRFSRMNAPLVTAVNGTAAGAGFSLAIAGDVIVAAESAKFTVAYTKIAMSADGGGSFNLPRIVGMACAKELMLLNPVLTAAEAQRRGLVTMVTPDTEVLAKAKEIAVLLASGPTQAYGEVKRLLADSHSHSLEQQLALESRSMAVLADGTADAREGYTAFVQKRAPKFTGR